MTPQLQPEASIELGVEPDTVRGAALEAANMRMVLGGFALHGADPASPLYERDVFLGSPVFGMGAARGRDADQNRRLALGASEEIGFALLAGHENDYLSPNDSRVFETAIVWAGRFNSRHLSSWPHPAIGPERMQDELRQSIELNAIRDAARRLEPYYGMRTAAYTAARLMLEKQVYDQARKDDGSLRPSSNDYRRILKQPLGSLTSLSGVALGKIIVPGSLRYEPIVVDGHEMMSAVAEARVTTGEIYIRLPQLETAKKMI